MPHKTLEVANVVITANVFNVSIFSQLWLQRHEIFREEEFISRETMFLPQLVQVGTETCHMLVVPERLQMILKTPDNPDPILDRVRSIVNLLPQTPYTALGLNMIWFLSMNEDERITDFTRRNFSVPNHPLYNYFSVEDAKFGAYISKQFAYFRLRADIKPVRLPDGSEKVQLSFNFNFDLPSVDNVAEVINESLTRWTEAFQETQTITDMLR